MTFQTPLDAKCAIYCTYRLDTKCAINICPLCKLQIKEKTKIKKPLKMNFYPSTFESSYEINRIIIIIVIYYFKNSIYANLV